MNQTSLLREQFSRGRTPEDLDGFYNGELVLLLPNSPLEYVASFLSKFFLPWRGKFFSKSTHIGDNILPRYTKPFLMLYPEKIIAGDDAFDGYHAFPFKTAKKRGLTDPIDVLELNYKLPENPQKIQSVVDELVEVANGEYLGKAYLHEEKSVRLVAFFKLFKA